MVFYQDQIEVIVDADGNPWFKRAHVGKFLGLKKILMSVEGLDKQEMVRRDDMDAKVSNPYSWCRPKYQQNKTDMVYRSILSLYFSIVKISPPLVLR